MLILFSGMVVSCNLSLSDEKREAIREGIEEQRITRVTESEIMSRAHERGRSLMHRIDSMYRANSGFETLSGELKQLESDHHVKIEWAGNNEEVPEKYAKLMEAYTFILSSEKDLLENVQLAPNQNYLYTWPVVSEQGDSVVLNGLWNIELERKYLVLDNR